MCNHKDKDIEQVLPERIKCTCSPQCPDHEPASTFVIVGVRAHDYWKLKASLAVLQAKIWDAVDAFDDFSHYDVKIVDYEVGRHVELKELDLLTAFPTLLRDLQDLKERKDKMQVEETQPQQQ